MLPLRAPSHFFAGIAVLLDGFFQISKTLAAALAAPESGSGHLSLFSSTEPGVEQNAIGKTKVITIAELAHWAVWATFRKADHSGRLQGWRS